MTDTRQQIIEAALALFGEIGYARATTRALAAAANVNEVTLFRHFGSKQNLFQVCIEYAVETGFAATFEDALTGDYRQDILIMARAQMQNMRENYEALRALMCDLGDLPDLRAIMIEAAQKNMVLLVRYFQNQIDQGTIRADLDPMVIVRAFDSLFSTSLFLERIIQPDSESGLLADDTLQQLVSLFIEGTINE